MCVMLHDLLSIALILGCPIWSGAFQRKELLLELRNSVIVYDILSFYIWSFSYISLFAGRLGPRRSDDGAPDNWKIDLKKNCLNCAFPSILSSSKKSVSKLNIEHQNFEHHFGRILDFMSNLNWQIAPWHCSGREIEFSCRKLMNISDSGVDGRDKIFWIITVIFS